MFGVANGQHWSVRLKLILCDCLCDNEGAYVFVLLIAFFFVVQIQDSVTTFHFFLRMLFVRKVQRATILLDTVVTITNE